MDIEGLMEGLRAEAGAARVEILPDGLFRDICEEESTVTAAGGNMPVINTGLKEIMKRDVRVVVFTEPSFNHHAERSMNMIDDKGHIVGHDLSREEIPEYMKRSDVVFISDNFVIYPEAQMDGTMFMEMLAHHFRGTGEWIPESMDPIIWYPCTSGSDMIFRHYGQSRGQLATGIMGVYL